MLKKILLILILPIIILVLIAVFFFKNPIQDYGTLYQSRSELVRDVSPQVTADLPSGWAILTYNSHMPFSDTVYEGLTDIVVLSQGKIIFYLSPVGDTGGGAGGNYYIFPDYDPSDLERMKGAPYMKFIEVEE